MNFRSNLSVPSSKGNQSNKNDCLALKIGSDRFYRKVPEERSVSSQTQVSLLFPVKGVLGSLCLAVLVRPGASLKVLGIEFGVDTRILLLPVS